jgi:hypothetical protein
VDKPNEKVDAVLNEALHPDEVEWDSFLKILCKDKNAKEIADVERRLHAGHLGEMTIQPITHKWDRVFRKYAMPILGAQMQPIEMLVSALVRDEMAVATEMGITKSLINADLEVDEIVHKAVGVICAAQDRGEKGDAKNKPALVEKWGAIAEDYLHRYELVALVEAQGTMQKEIASLGESFAARFRALQSLVGDRLDLTRLALDSLKPAAKLSDLTGMSDITSLSSATGSSESAPTPGSTPTEEKASA